MPPYKRKYVVRDPYEDEFLFQQLINYPEFAKQLLLPNELKIFKNAATIRKFINSATRDQKQIILAKANIFSITMYVDMNKEFPLNKENFNKVYKQYGTVEKRQQVIEMIKKANIFAVSTREVISFAYLIAQNCHTPYWFVNKDYAVVADKILKTLPESKTDNIKIKETISDRKVIAKFVFALLNSENLIRFHLKLDWLDISIFSVLFIHADTMVFSDTVCERIPAYNKYIIKRRLFSLHKEGYIDVNRSNDKRLAYTIAEPGIRAFCELLEKIAHSAVNS